MLSALMKLLNWFMGHWTEQHVRLVSAQTSWGNPFWKTQPRASKFPFLSTNSISYESWYITSAKIWDPNEVAEVNIWASGGCRSGLCPDKKKLFHHHGRYYLSTLVLGLKCMEHLWNFWVFGLNLKSYFMPKKNQKKSQMILCTFLLRTLHYFRHFLAPENKKKTPSKVAHNRPPFFFQYC